MMHSRSALRGFTLIELLVTLSIAAVLMMVVIPGLTTFQRNAKLTSLTNSLIASLNTARAEAMKRSKYAMLVPINADGTWTGGWKVIVDVDLSKTYSTGDITILDATGEVPSYVSVTGTDVATGPTAYVLFDSQGYSRSATGFATPTLTIARNDVSGSEVYQQQRKIKIATTGRAASCKPTSATDPNC
jgi:type IV fimbrial biogenesis protein FimT